MEPVSMKELWMLLGEKDVQIYQLLKTNEVLMAQLAEVLTKLEEMNRDAGGHTDGPDPSATGQS